MPFKNEARLLGAVFEAECVMFSRAPESDARGCATKSQPTGLRVEAWFRALHKTSPLHVSGHLRYRIVSVGGHRGIRMTSRSEHLVG